MIDFPDEEFVARFTKAQRKMNEKNLDAIFLTTEAEVRYFTGFRTQFWQSPARPWFLILPADGEPIAVIPEIGNELMEKTWVNDIRTWAAPYPNDEGVSLLKSIFENYTRIGMPMGSESSLRMPLLDFQNLSKEGGFEFLDCSDIIRQLRMVKSSREIEILKTICAIGSKAFDEVKNLVFAGQGLDEAFRAFKIELLKKGADDVPYLVGGAGPLGYKDVISPPNKAPLVEGDILMFDTGATKAGYFCDFDRNFAISHCDDRAQFAHEKLWLATEIGLQNSRPGVLASSVFEKMNEALGNENSSVGRLGHGLGMQLTEWPSFVGWDDTVLCEGMVLTLEPSVSVFKDTMMVSEENILITDGEPLLLTKRATKELPII